MKNNNYIKIIICALFVVNSLAINGMYSRFYSPTTWKRRAATPVGTLYRGYARPAFVGPEKQETLTKPSFMERLKSFWYGTVAYEKPEVKESQPLITRPYGPKAPTPAQQKNVLLKEKAKLEEELSSVPNKEYAIQYYPYYYGKQIELENVKSHLSRKAPLDKNVPQLRKEKDRLNDLIKRIETRENYYRSAKKIIPYDEELSQHVTYLIKLDTVNNELQKYEKLQKQRQKRAGQTLVE